MLSLDVHHLWFTCTAQTTVHFGPQAGAQLRGALWDTLQPIIGDTDLLERLMALETPDAARGNNPARPFSIRPPLTDDPAADRLYRPGESFQFGISLFGTVIDLFPYVVQAVYHMGSVGVGYGRGQFSLDDVQATNPLTTATQPLLSGGRITGLPAVPVTAEQVTEYSRTLPHDRIRLHFITPTQLRGRDKRLLSKPVFDRLIARLLERCQTIAENYGTEVAPQADWRDLYLDLTTRATRVKMSDHDTRWVTVRSGSRRTNTGKKISGFTGYVTYAGDLADFLPWLVWGQSLQVGKNTVKGDGWYRVV